MAIAALAATTASAQPRPDSDPVAAAPAGHAARSIMVWRIDALGIDQEIVDRLEALFRVELERLSSQPLPSRRAVVRSLRRSRRLRGCEGDTRCLAAIGKHLGVDLVVSGNVGALGDSYVINLKAVDSATGEELRRVDSEPLRGNPDELIEAVRVAAYRLVAPERLRGSLAVLANIGRAKVRVDGELVGVTPLPPIDDLALGEHTLSVSLDGFEEFRETVHIRFQKTTRVVVRLLLGPPLPPDPLGNGPLTPLPAPKTWYSSPWFYATVAVAAVAVGGLVGWGLARDSVVDCTGMPELCTR